MRRVDHDFGRCGPGWSPHHLIKSAQQGGYDTSNLISLCPMHNSLLESDAEYARWGKAVGLVIVTGDTIGDAWQRLADHGLVTYGPGPFITDDPGN